MRETLRIPEWQRPSHSRPLIVAAASGWGLALFLAGLLVARPAPARAGAPPPPPRLAEMGPPPLSPVDIRALLVQDRSQEALREIARCWAFSQEQQVQPPAELPELFAQAMKQLANTPRPQLASSVPIARRGAPPRLVRPACPAPLAVVLAPPPVDLAPLTPKLPSRDYPLASHRGRISQPVSASVEVDPIPPGPLPADLPELDFPNPSGPPPSAHAYQKEFPPQIPLATGGAGFPAPPPGWGPPGGAIPGF